MVNILVGNKNSNEADMLYQELTDDKNYRIENVTTGVDTLTTYWRLNPDIFVLDNNLPDMSIKDIIDRLSCNPIEEKKCNTILTVPVNYVINLKNVSKVNSIIYKPILNNELVNRIKEMSVNYNTPDLEFGDVEWLLQSLNFNCMSVGYRYMRDAITYCYYRPNELEFLSNILKYLAYKYNVPESRVRDSLKSSIRPFNHSTVYSCPNDLLGILYNNGCSLSLKDFIERVVFYLIKIKNKGRIF